MNSRIVPDSHGALGLLAVPLGVLRDQEIQRVSDSNLQVVMFVYSLKKNKGSCTVLALLHLFFVCICNRYQMELRCVDD